jgi:hypothetical protein
LFVGENPTQEGAFLFSLGATLGATEAH